MARVVRRAAALAAGGASVALLSGRAAGSRRSAESQQQITRLCGTYRLLLSDEESGADDRLCSGLLTYESDGKMSCHVVRQRKGGQREFGGYSGRWWLHNSSTSFGAQYPPHDGPLIEHEIGASTNANWVGSNQVRRRPRHAPSFDPHARSRAALAKPRTGAAVQPRRRHAHHVLCGAARRPGEALRHDAVAEGVCSAECTSVIDRILQCHGLPRTGRTREYVRE